MTSRKTGLDWLVNISNKTQSTTKFSRPKFHDFLPDIDMNYFFIKPVDKTENQNIISHLNPIKSTDPNEILTKILKIHSNDISLGIFPKI